MGLSALKPKLSLLLFYKMRRCIHCLWLLESGPTHTPLEEIPPGYHVCVSTVYPSLCEGEVRYFGNWCLSHLSLPIMEFIIPLISVCLTYKNKTKTLSYLPSLQTVPLKFCSSWSFLQRLSILYFTLIIILIWELGRKNLITKQKSYYGFPLKAFFSEGRASPVSYCSTVT